jgi:hypothetical protein
LRIGLEDRGATIRVGGDVEGVCYGVCDGDGRWKVKAVAMEEGDRWEWEVIKWEIVGGEMTERGCNLTKRRR